MIVTNFLNVDYNTILTVYLKKNVNFVILIDLISDNLSECKKHLMKKIFSIVIIFSFLMSSCGSSKKTVNSTKETKEKVDTSINEVKDNAHNGTNSGVLDFKVLQYIAKYKDIAKREIELNVPMRKANENLDNIAENIKRAEANKVYYDKQIREGKDVPVDKKTDEQKEVKN